MKCEELVGVGENMLKKRGLNYKVHSIYNTNHKIVDFQDWDGNLADFLQHLGSSASI